MKRLISLALVLVMVLALGTAAFAADPVTVPDKTLTKQYTVEGVPVGTIYPAETLTFTATARTTNPDGGAANISVTAAATDTATGKAAITIAFPTAGYSKVGVYEYEVSETAGNGVAVDYDTTKVLVRVTIVNDDSATGQTDVLKVGSVTVRDLAAADPESDDAKIGENDAAFENTYTVGKLTVSKTVAGNLASNEYPFEVYVTFTNNTAKDMVAPLSYTAVGATAATEVTLKAGASEKVTINLKNGESVAFNNIPEGISYEVAEKDYKPNGDKNKEDEGYTTTYTGETTGTIADAEVTVGITNTKAGNPDTGITLDSLPYILIALVAVIAIAVVVIRKRRVEE